MDINETVTYRIAEEKTKRRIPWVAIGESASLNADQLKRRRDGKVSWGAGEVAQISQFLQIPLEDLFKLPPTMPTK